MRLFWCLGIAALLAGGVHGQEAKAANRSRELSRIIASGEANLSALRAYHFILVPGFLNEKEIELLGWKLFQPQIDVLVKGGISYERFTYDEDRVVKTARALTLRIAKSQKPVILIAHSLGAQVALEALLVDGRFDDPRAVTHKGEAYVELDKLCLRALRRACGTPVLPATRSIRDKVAGLITLNGNIAGTPLVDLIFDERVSFEDAFVRTYLNLRPRSLSANLFEMSQEVAGARLRDNRAEINGLVRRLPVLSLSAVYTPRMSRWTGRPKDQVDRLGAILKQQGFIRTDGVVPTRNEVLPGADHVILNEVSHFEMVKDFSEMNVDSRRVMTAILRMLARDLR